MALRILRDLVKWRDSIAVIEDESPNFVASNAAVLKIAQMHPVTAEELDACLEGCSTPSLDSYRADLVVLVKRYVAPPIYSNSLFAK
jgi:ribonuclease D